jgi:hypothetical protein
MRVLPTAQAEMWTFRDIRTGNTALQTWGVAADRTDR